MVKSAIFISPYCIPQEMPLIAKVVLVPGIGDYIITVIGDSIFKKQLKKNFHRPLNYGEIEKKYCYQMRFKGSKRALLMTMRNWMQNDYSKSFKTVAVNRIPSILLWGENDAVIPFKQSGEIISLIPEIEFFPLENMGHNPLLEDPEKITSIIAAFIREKQ
jgi:pimeloyl-ACP methyl ester carboxylesterase